MTRRIAWAPLPLALATALCLCPVTPGAAAESEAVGQELELLWAEVQGLKADQDRSVLLNGYYDFEYLADNSELAGPSTFRQHHLSLFLGASKGPWRLLSEVEFEDGAELVGDGTTVAGTGAIKVENGWLEHVFSDALTLRGGKMLLPHYWNVNHYPNIVLSTNRPLMVRQVFPTDITGAMAFGNRYRGALGATWHLYMGNGQTDGATDDNENKAAGGHATLHLGDLWAPFVRLDLGGGLHSERTGTAGAADAFDAWGVDAQVNTRALEILFEYAYRSADAEREGLYIQPALRVAENVRVFYRYDRLDRETGRWVRHTVGVNVQPRHDVSLKLEVNTNEFENPAVPDCEQVAASVVVFF